MNSLSLIFLSNIATILVTGAIVMTALNAYGPGASVGTFGQEQQQGYADEFHRAMQTEECCDCDTGGPLAPTAAPNGNNCPEGTFFIAGLGCLCFSGESMVETPSGGIPLSDLSVGDLVKTSTGYEPVYAFGHYAPKAIGEFVEVHAGGNKIQLSASHMIRNSEGSFVPAGALKVGDSLQGGNTIEKISSAETEGVFAPFTPSGTIMVDGMDASCYVAFDSNLEGSLNIAGVQFSGQWLAHTFEFPHRVACHYLGGTCESYNANGVSTFVAGPFEFFKTILASPIWMQTLVMSAAVVLLLVFQAVELVVFQQPVLLLLALGAFYMARTEKKLA